MYIEREESINSTPEVHIPCAPTALILIKFAFTKLNLQSVVSY